MSARTESQKKMLANVTIPTVPATAFIIMKSRGGHDRDRHVAGRLCP